MKIKILFTVLLLALTGCSLLGSGPRETVEKYLSNAKEANLDGMSSLISDRLIKETGADIIKKDNEKFSDAVQNGNYKMQIISESVDGDNAKIIFFYKDDERNDSVRLGFKLVRQNGDWKIDSYGFGDPDGEAPSDSESYVPPPTPSGYVEPPPPPEPENSKTPKKK